MYRDSYTCTHMQIYRYIHDSIQTYMSPCTCIYIHVSLSICTCIAGASLHANMYIVCMYACKPACTNKYSISIQKPIYYVKYMILCIVYLVIYDVSCYLV